MSSKKNFEWILNQKLKDAYQVKPGYGIRKALLMQSTYKILILGFHH